MRVAISGSHRTGKSTLLAELSRRLPSYTAVDEPYHLMQEDGHDFSHPPSLEDFEAQLERWIEESSHDAGDVLFDRCALDFLAYVAVHEDAESFDFDAWIGRARAAVDTLDLVVLVPVEARDRIALSASDDDDETRRAVDEKLKELLLDDPFELGIEVLEVEGDLESRVEAVLRRIHPSRR